MNISNLSQKTLEKLVELAIACSPTKAAYLLLHNETIVSPTEAVTVVEKKPEWSYYERQLIERQLIKERKEAFEKIMSAIKIKDKIQAIRELRVISGLGLKEAKDTIEVAFSYIFGNISGYDRSVSTENYWVRALQKYANSNEVILG